MNLVLYKRCCLVIIMAVIGIMFQCCRKFVQVSAPTDRLVSSSVFNNSLTATAAQLSIYAQMSSQSYNISHDLGLSSDELKNFSSTSIRNDQFYRNALSPLSNLGIWSDAFSYIYQENSIIEGLSKQNLIDPRIQSQIEGEAKFLRAFWYFYLVNTYGDVPIITTTDYHINIQSVRSAKTMVYAQIVSDLISAKNLLNLQYVDNSDTGMSSTRVRPNKWTASALLSRVYLYEGKYDSALSEANDIISQNTQYKLESDLDNVFLSTSSEAIWQLETPQPTGSSTVDGQLYILVGAPSDVAISDHLLKAFEYGDLRQQKWISSYVGSSTYSYPFKYKVRIALSDEYVTVLRLAEIYLIRSEARLKSGDKSGAIDDLNIIRARAGLSNYSGDQGDFSLLNAILHERQVELFIEWGHRWLDLKRLNAIDSIMNAPGNVSVSKGSTWDLDGHQELFPIWRTEISLDPRLTQNVGY